MRPAPPGTLCALCGDALGPYVQMAVAGEPIGYVCEPCEQATMVLIAVAVRREHSEAEARAGMLAWLEERDRRPAPFSVRRWPGRLELADLVGNAGESGGT